MVFICHFFGYINYSTNSVLENTLINRFIMEGHLGVNLFFVLSGFLITYLLFVEKNKNGKINISYFYMRRILRIWPIYFLVLAISFFLIPFLTNQYSPTETKEHLPYYLLFINNFDRIYTNFAGTSNDSLGVLWSIAVEEQFYLFWPLLLSIINKKYYMPLFVSIIIASLIFRTFHAGDYAMLYFNTLSVMSDLAVGAILAYISFYETRFFVSVQNCKKLFIAGVYILLILAVFYFKKWSQINLFTQVTERLVFAVLFAFVIGEQCYAKNSVFKLVKLKNLSQLGIISYGLYSLHLYSISIIQKFNISMGYNTLGTELFYTELFIAFGISVVVCYLSYHLYEKKILRYKTKFITINND